MNKKIALVMVILLTITLLLLSFYNNNKKTVKIYTPQESFINGAKKFVKRKPEYYSNYYKGGYPTDNKGVCTDIIWYSFRCVGINFKSLIDEDIRNNRESYPYVREIDPNIDFRRVKNIRVFLERKAISLTTDLNEKEEWQAGDIIIYNDDEHIAILSDKKNEEGLPYILHLNPEGAKEEDKITKDTITYHFRWRFE